MVQLTRGGSESRTKLAWRSCAGPCRTVNLLRSNCLRKSAAPCGHAFTTAQLLKWWLLLTVRGAALLTRPTPVVLSLFAGPWSIFWSVSVLSADARAACFSTGTSVTSRMSCRQCSGSKETKISRGSLGCVDQC